LEIIKLKNIHKIYSDGTHALDDITFTVREGEIHGLIGENGAGKTTLMKIVYGSLQPSKGSIFIRGNPVILKNPSDAITLGIGMVYQQFALINPFTAAENIILGFEPGGGPLMDIRDAEELVGKLSEETGLDVDPKARVESLSIGCKQRVEILKMLFRGAKILILDEPTSVLTPTEIKDFFAILLRLRDQGATIILVTHKLQEVLEICDRITVLRNGRVSGILEAKDSTPQILARMMVGRDVIFRLQKERRSPKREPLLDVNGITVHDDNGTVSVNNLSFHLKAGEILGIAGVEGNGQTELEEALTGLRAIESGEINIRGKTFHKLDPNMVRRLGVAHIPSDKERGLITDLSLEENLILGFQSVEPYTEQYRLDFAAISRFAKDSIANFQIKTLNEKAQVRYLSGGNQQRVVVARELSHNPEIIIAAQPTRGLDVASTEYVRSILLAMRKDKKGILMITTDLDEARQLSDRLAIMYRGSFMDIIQPNEVTDEDIGLLMGGQKLSEGMKDVEDR
jgi:simple sugar transport system ATP-binding protein